VHDRYRLRAYSRVIICTPLTGPDLSGRGYPQQRGGRMIPIPGSLASLAVCTSEKRETRLFYPVFSGSVGSAGAGPRRFVRFFLCRPYSPVGRSLSSIMAMHETRPPGRILRLKSEGMPTVSQGTQRVLNPKAWWAGIGLDSRLELSTKQSMSRLSADDALELSRGHAQNQLR